MLLLLKGSTSGFSRGRGSAGTHGDLTCRAMRITVVILAIADVAANTLDMLLVRRAAAVSGTFFHGNSLPYL